MKFFLVIEVAHSPKGILLSQKKYILDLLIEIGFMECQPAKTPIEVNHKLAFNESEEKVDIGRYLRKIGKLICLTHTPPDITHAVNILSQFMHSPRISHLQAAQSTLVTERIN